MDFSVLLAGVAAVILVIILIRLAAKNLFKIVAVSAVIIALAVYLFVVFGNADEDIKFAEVFTEYTLEDLTNLYCTNSMSRTDSLKCYCIVQPLMQDMKTRHSEKELKKMHINQRGKYGVELLKSIRNQKGLIKKKLEENNAKYLWKDIYKDLKNKAKFLN